MSERKRRLYRATITEAIEQPVPMLIQGDDERVPDDEKVRVPFPTSRDPKAELVFVPVDWIYPWNGDPDQDDEPMRWFTVGQSRAYLSRRGAEHKAAVWIAHGCKVRIDVSEPIVWTAP